MSSTQAIEEVVLTAPDTAPLHLTVTAPADDKDVSPHRDKLESLRGILAGLDHSPAVAAEAASLISDDYTLYRFLQAREYKLDGAVDMFKQACEFRAKHRVNELFAELHPLSPTGVRHAAVREHFYAGYSGACRTSLA